MRLATLTVFALLLLFVPSRLHAEEPPTTEPPALEEPQAAWAALNAEVRKLPYAQRRPALKKGAEAYLERWKASGRV